MANLERIQANNALIQNCIDKANSLPNAGGGGNSEFIKSLIEEGMFTEIKAEDLQGFTKIRQNLFFGCENLETVTLPDSITEIGSGAFSECPLSWVKFGKNISTIGHYVFTSIFLEYLDFTDCLSIPTIQESSFAWIESSCEIRVPAGLAIQWKNATNWSQYESQIVGV